MKKNKETSTIPSKYIFSTECYELNGVLNMAVTLPINRGNNRALSAISRLFSLSPTTFPPFQDLDDQGKDKTDLTKIGGPITWTLFEAPVNEFTIKRDENRMYFEVFTGVPIFLDQNGIQGTDQLIIELNQSNNTFLCSVKLAVHKLEDKPVNSIEIRNKEDLFSTYVLSRLTMGQDESSYWIPKYMNSIINEIKGLIDLPKSENGFERIRTSLLSLVSFFRHPSELPNISESSGSVNSLFRKVRKRTFKSEDVNISDFPYILSLLERLPEALIEGAK